MVGGRFNAFRRVEPITSSVDYGAFLATRASFICQKSLYGYVKTRMGMKYPEYFQDDVYVESLNIAKWQIYAACLSDLSIFMAALVHARTGDRDEAARIALHHFNATIDDRFTASDFTGDAQAIREAFANRLALVNWAHAAEGEGAFRESPKALVRWAPIADELKVLDAEIVENSIRFQWRAIRDQFRKVFDFDAFIADWRRLAA